MTYINGNRPVALPAEVRATTLEDVSYQPKDTFVAASHPYWHAFTVGVSEGFWGMLSVLSLQACNDQGSPLLNTRDGSTGDSGTPSDAAGDATMDAGSVVVDAQADDADAMATDVSETSDDVVLADTATETDVEGIADAATETDAIVDVPVEVTTTQDAADDADAASLPDDATAEADVFCQYQSQCPGYDVGLPAEVTMADDVTATSDAVGSQLCGSLGGALTLAAPVNSAVVACTNDTINALIKGSTGCVAECAFFDSAEITLSANPNDPDLLAPTFFDQNWNPKAEVTLTLNAPLLSDGTSPALPDVMGTSYTFKFNVSQSLASGISVWIAKDQDANGNPMTGTITLGYQPADLIFNPKGILDISYNDPSVGSVQYRYPCDQLPNPIIQCTEVK